jgi:YgiT-type zinc finger domain-containing protein
MTEIEQETEEKPAESSSAESGTLCSECHAGVMRLQYLTYFTWLNQELITVPNFPSWVCDVCGRRDYDPRAISWLNTLLNPGAGRRVSMRHKSLPPRETRLHRNPVARE